MAPDCRVLNYVLVSKRVLALTRVYGVQYSISTARHCQGGECVLSFFRRPLSTAKQLPLHN